MIDPITFYSSFYGVIAATVNYSCFDLAEHFRVDEVRIVGSTPEGRATVQLLQLNSFQRLAERLELKKAGRFPVAT